MTELPKSLQELTAQTDKAVGSPTPSGDSSGKLIEDALAKNGAAPAELTRTSAESKPDPLKPEEKKEEKKDDGSALDFAGGTVKGFGKGLLNLVTDTKKLFTNYDDAAIRKAAMSGSGVTNSGISFLGSIGKSGSELATAGSVLISNPGATIKGLGNQISSDWNKGDSSKKGEMFGEGLSLVATFGVGSTSLSKGLSRLSRFGKAEELVAGAEVLANAGKVEATLGKGAALAREAGAAERLLGTGTELGKARSLEGTMVGLTDAGKLTKGESVLGTARLGEGGPLATRVEGLTGASKAADLKAGSAVVDASAGSKAAGLGKGADLTAAAQGADLTAATKGADVTAATKGADVTAATQGADLTTAAKAGEVSPYSRIIEADQLAAEMQTSGRALTQPAKVGRELVAADSGLAAGSEGQALTRQSKALEDAVAAARLQPTEANLSKVRAAVGEYNQAVEAAKLGAEAKISPKALSEFETAAGRSSDFASAGKLEAPAYRDAGKLPAPVYREAELAGTRVETSGQALTSKLDDARAVSSASKAGEAMAVDQKAVEVEQAMRNVKTAETAAAREQAITDLRGKVGEFNTAVETSGATAAKAGDLKIADKTLAEFEAASRQAGEARSLAFRSSTAARTEGEAQAISQSLQRGRQAAEGTDAAATVSQRAQEVENSVLRARAAENAAARESALADVRSSTKAYNAAIEGNAATASKAAELKIADSQLAEFQAAARESQHARILAKNEVLVTTSSVATDAKAAALTQDLNASRAAATAGARGDAALSLEQKARQVEESIQMARAAEGGTHHAWALQEVRANVEAYNAAVAGSGLPALRAKELQVSEQALAAFEAAAKESNLARATAQREILFSGDFIRRNMAGRSDLVFAGEAGVRPLAGRADGLVGGQIGSVRAAMDRLAAIASGAWREGGYVARGFSRADAAALAYTGAGTWIVARDLYLLGDRTIDRIMRMHYEQQAQEARATQNERERADAVARSSSAQQAAAAERTERAAAAERRSAQGPPADLNSAVPAARPSNAQPSTVTGARAGADLSAPNREAAQRQAGEPFERNAARQAAQVGRDDLTLSPVLHAMRAPAYQATPALASTAEMFVQRQKEIADRRRRRGENQYEAEWYGTHVYRAAPPPAAEAEARPVPVAHQQRKFGGAEPEIPRTVNPSFKPQVIYATQAELFGQSARPGDAKMLVVGADGARRVRTTLLNDEQKLVKQYPFLVTAAGETGLSTGSKTVFKLAGVEKREPKTERPGGGSSSAAQNQAGVPGGGEPQPAMAAQSQTGQQDPNAPQDEES